MYAFVAASTPQLLNSSTRFQAQYTWVATKITRATFATCPDKALPAAQLCRRRPLQRHSPNAVRNALVSSTWDFRCGAISPCCFGLARSCLNPVSCVVEKRVLLRKWLREPRHGIRMCGLCHWIECVWRQQCCLYSRWN